jgi:hypothetical protein
MLRMLYDIDPIGLNLLGRIQKRNERKMQDSESVWQRQGGGARKPARSGQKSELEG